MAEQFTSPVGVLSETETQTWSLVVDNDGNFALRSNSPSGQGQARLSVNDETGMVTIGTTQNPATLDLIGIQNVSDQNGNRRASLSAFDQCLELLDGSNNVIGKIGGAGDVRAGSNGEDGDLFLYPADAPSIADSGAATVHLDGGTGDMTLGGNETHGSAFLNDVEGTTRVRLNAASQRIEMMSREGEIIAMMGGSANVRAGSNGQDGNLFLYRSNAKDIFSNSDATVQLGGSNGNMVLGGNGTGGDVFLQDGSGTNRVLLSAESQRLEVKNANGEIIGMIGGSSTVRVGSNGDNGRVFLYPATAGNIFDNGEATIRMDGNSGDIVLQNADFAEDFDIADAEDIEALPGSVMVLRDDGALEACSKAYDSRLVGVVSGAGGYKPGIVMDKQDSGNNRCPIALVGKVFCRVDADHAPVEMGDLLTTSPTAGCAMKASDRTRAFGAVLGKALAAHAAGVGLVPVLVNLQ